VLLRTHKKSLDDPSRYVKSEEIPNDLHYETLEIFSMKILQIFLSSNFVKCFKKGVDFFV